MFKIPKEEDIEAVLKEYEILRENAVKVNPNPNLLTINLYFTNRTAQDGEKYIISNVARRVLNTGSPLSEGFTIASQSVFKDMADHQFYDETCPAHKELKACPFHPNSIESIVSQRLMFGRKRPRK